MVTTPLANTDAQQYLLLRGRPHDGPLREWLHALLAGRLFQHHNVEVPAALLAPGPPEGPVYSVKP